MIKKILMSLTASLALFILSLFGILSLTKIIIPLIGFTDARYRIMLEIASGSLALLMVVKIFLQRKRLLSNFVLTKFADFIHPKMIELYGNIFLFVIGTSLTFYLIFGLILLLLDGA